MINDDTLINFSMEQIKIGHRLFGNWVDYTRFLKDQLLYIILGFPGIGNGDLSIIGLSHFQVTPGTRLILDDNLDGNCGSYTTDHAALLGRVVWIEPGTFQCKFEIEGIGQGADFTRDPDRELHFGDVLDIDLSKYPTLLIVNSVPRNNGGPVYHYYNRYSRDSRW